MFPVALLADLIIPTTTPPSFNVIVLSFPLSWIAFLSTDLLFFIVPLFVMVELAPTIIVPLLPLLVISPPALFVMVLPVSSSLKIIALLDEPVLIEVIWPLFSIVVLSPPVPAFPRIVFPGEAIIPPLLFVIVIPPSEPLRLIAFELLPLAPKA